MKFKGTSDDDFTWDDWDKEVKKRWPIRFYLFDTLADEISHRWKWWVTDPIWKFKHRFIPKHKYHILRTGLKPGYHDPDTQMLYSWMKLNKEFIDGTSDTIDWEQDSQKEIYSDIFKVYEWWENYEIRLKEIDNSYDNMDDMVEMEFNEKKVMVHRSSMLEEELNKEAAEMLCILAKRRINMWYP